MPDPISNIAVSGAQQIQQQQVEKLPIQQYAEDVAKVLFDTRDASGLSDRTFKVLEKDWGRFVQHCNSKNGLGEAPKPLPMEEANNDFLDYVEYMKAHGDKVKLGTTRSTMKEIVETDMAEAKKNAGNGFWMASNLAHLISQDPRIPSDYCFLRQPAEEFTMSASSLLELQWDRYFAPAESSQGPQSPGSPKQEETRMELVNLLGDDRWHAQLEGSALESLKGELSVPGAPVGDILSRALSGIEGGYVTEHQKRAAELAQTIGRTMNADPDTLKTLSEVGSFYQIGKLAVPAEILDCKGQWPAEKRKEWGMKMGKMADPELVGPMLKGLGVSEAGKAAIIQHKQDYKVWNPETRAKDKLNPQWESVPLAARILRLADSVDSMTHNKNGNARDGDRNGTLEPEKIAAQLDGQVDPDVVKAYLSGCS